jgi:uncharacterized protein YicC (UPF0701 family)
MSEMPKIDLNRLKIIIREEIETISEGADHEAAAAVANTAAKLLKAIDAFKETSGEKLKSDVTMHIAELEKTLNRVVASPMSYVDTVIKPKPTKKVSFKPIKGEVM